jgi:hypothetical protein
MPRLPDSIRYSETMGASMAELIEAVREQGLLCGRCYRLHVASAFAAQHSRAVIAQKSQDLAGIPGSRPCGMMIAPHINYRQLAMRQ